MSYHPRYILAVLKSFGIIHNKSWGDLEKWIAIFTEHLFEEGQSSNFSRDNMISSQLCLLEQGMILVGCDEKPTHWRLHAIFSSIEEAEATHLLLRSGVILI